MGYKTTSSRTLAAASAVASSYVPINTGGGTITVTGAGVKANTTISTAIITPGQVLTTNVISAPVIGNIQYLDSNNSVIVGDIAVSTTGGNILINGSGFVANSRVFLNGSLVANTFISSSQILAVCPASSAGNVSLMIFTPTNSGALSSTGVRYSGIPSWTTAAVSFQNESAANVALVASSDSTLTYTLQDGSTLPTGISLISTGYLSGTATGYSTNTTTSAVIIATDSEGQATQQTINITVTVADPQFNYTALLLNGETSVTSFIKDSSANNCGLTIAGDTRADMFSPYYGDGYYSNYFNGSTDYITVPTNTGLTLGAGDFTIEAWVYTTLTNQTYGSGIIGTYDGGTNGGWSLIINRSSGGTYGIAFIHANAIQQSYATYLTTNDWHHIAVTRTSGTLKTFLDGVQVATGTYSATDTVSATCYIGSQGIGQYHSGYISNLRVLKGTSLYSSAFTPSTTPLTAVANTSLLLCQSNRFVDDSSNALAVTVAGAPKVSMAIPFTSSNSYATYGSAYFDGTGDYLTVPDNAAFAFGTGNFTAEAWVYITNIANSPWIIGQWEASANSDTNSSWQIATAGSKFTGYMAYNNSISQLAITGTSTILNNTWYHVALVRNGTTAYLYVNGVQEGSSASVASYSLNNSTLPISIGQRTGGTQYMNGYIADVRVTNAAAYTTAFAPPTQPLSATANTQLLTLQYNGGANTYGIIDNGPLNNVITRTGNAVQGTFSPFSPTGWATQINSASGNAGSILVASNANLNAISGDFTFEFWGMRTAISAFNTVMMNASTTSFCRINSAGTMSILSATTTTAQADARVFAAIGRWFHMAISRQSGTVYVHIDGVQIISFAYASNVSFSGGTTSSACLIGNYNNNTGQEWVGYMSNMRVVTGRAVYALNSSFTPSTTPLTAVSGTQLLMFQSNRFIDNSANNVAVTLAGTVPPSISAISPFAPANSYSPSLNGGSCYFDGTGDYLSLPEPPAASAGTDVTVELWVYPTSFTARNFLISAGPAGTGAWAISLEGTTGAVGIWIDGYSTPRFSSSVLPRLRQWNHIALVKTAGTIYVYVNGVRDSGSYTQAGAFGTGPTTTITIGAYNVSLNQLTFGYLSDVRYTKALSVYTGATVAVPSAPLTKTPRTALLCNFTNGGIVDAHSSNSFEAMGNTQISTSVKKYGNASIYFDGSGDYIQFPSTSQAIAFGTGDFTVECWVNFATNNGTYNPIVRYDSTSTFDFGYDFSSGQIKYQAATALVVVNQSFTVGTWYHVAVCRSSGSSRVFVNGIQVGTTAADTNNYAVGAFKIGGSSFNASHVMSGYIDDLRITKGYARYTANFTPSTYGLLGQ